MVELLSPDQEAVRGPLDNLGDGCVPGVAGASLDGDGEGDQVGRQVLWRGAGVASSPFSIGEEGRPPALKGWRGRQWEGLTIGIGTEEAFEFPREDGADPGTDVDIPLGTKAVESPEQEGLDAAMDPGSFHEPNMLSHVSRPPA